MSDTNNKKSRHRIGPAHHELLTFFIPTALAASNAYLLLFGMGTGSFFTLIKHIYNLNTIIVPPILLAASGYIILFRKRIITKKTHLLVSIGYVLLAFSLVGIRIYATHIEPYKLITREVTIKTEKVNKPIHILHITDIQADIVDCYLEKAFNNIKALDPDLILFTGDLLQPIPPYTIDSELPKIDKLFKSLNPPLGIYGIIGDVDYFLTGFTRRQLYGFQLLDGKEILLNDENAKLRIFGLTQKQSRSNIAGLTKEWLKTASDSDFTILMGHAPDYILSMNDQPVDLCLAGHTHGGQIRIPFIGPIITLSSVPRKLARGFHEIGNTNLNVSAGIGSEHSSGLPAIRFNCPTEMTLIELIPLKQ